ncbi:MGDG synthase family glycosyltransferase [Paenibacillus xerothermodurans]|nr:glycosyltransferase [Paenibacillus xerothermodurans]
MMHNPRIIILTASYGEGHIQAASAIQQSLQRKGIDQVQVVDLIKLAHPLFHTVSSFLYTKSTTFAQLGIDYYGWLYHATRGIKPDGLCHRYFGRLGRFALSREIERQRPDAVISTFPYGAATAVCRHLDIPNFTVVTDYTLHGIWLHRGVDKYYVACPELKEELVFHGFPRGRIEVSGIPIRSAFEDLSRTDLALNGNGMNNDTHTLLILAGSYMRKTLHQLIRTLTQLTNVQLVVVCGRNKKAEHELRLAYANQPRLSIFGYVENMDELMADASCIVTKAGGLTLSEAIALKKPIFIFQPYSGQEYENAKFLVRQKAAFCAGNVRELALQVSRVLSDESLTREMKRTMAGLRKKAASDYIVHNIIEAIGATPERAKTE